MYNNSEFALAATALSEALDLQFPDNTLLHKRRDWLRINDRVEIVDRYNIWQHIKCIHLHSANPRTMSSLSN
jgi:hypothetical protein